MERTRSEFMEQLRKQDKLWKQLAGNGTDKQTQEWLLQRIAQVVLMGDEIARLNIEIYKMQVEHQRLVREAVEKNPDIGVLARKAEDTILQTKSLSNQMDGILAQIYNVIGAKLGDLRAELDL